MSPDSNFFAQLEVLIIESVSEPDLSSAAEVLAQIGACAASIAILEKGVITTSCITTKDSNESTLFQACSISKPITATALMRVIQEGFVSLSTKIVSVLPTRIVEHLTGDPRTTSVMNTISIQHLLTHTGGISVHGFPGYADPENVPSLEDVILGKGNTAPIELITLPGLEVMYAGGGTELLQMMMEHVLQKTFPEIMHQYVFEPLGMTRSFFKIPGDEQNVERCYSNGHWPTDVPYHILVEQAAGGVWTTPSDLLKLVRAMQNSLNHGKENFLDPALANQMVTAVKEAAALGWFVGDQKSAHSGGNNPGWICFAVGYADLPQNLSDRDKREDVKRALPTDCGIGVMTNSFMGVPVVDKLVDAIAYLKGWPSVHISGALGTGDTTPFRAPKSVEVDHGWNGWLNKKWAKEWDLVEDHNGLPAIEVPGLHSPLSLKPAAIPPREFDDGRKSIDLIFDGFQLMLRLTWDGDERVIELWNGGAGKHQTLKVSADR